MTGLGKSYDRVGDKSCDRVGVRFIFSSAVATSKGSRGVACSQVIQFTLWMHSGLEIGVGTQGTR